jgi:hypothetical protein
VTGAVASGAVVAVLGKSASFATDRRHSISIACLNDLFTSLDFLPDRAVLLTVASGLKPKQDHDVTPLK